MILGIGQTVKSVLYQNGTIGPRRSSPALRSISTLLLGSVRFVMFFYANVKVLFLFSKNCLVLIKEAFFCPLLCIYFSLLLQFKSCTA